MSPTQAKQPITIAHLVNRLSVLALILSSSLQISAASAGELTIYTENDPPYVIVDANGLVGGLTKPKLDRFLRAIPYPNQQIKVQPWVRAYHEATSKPNTLIYPIVKTPEREKKLTYLYQLYEASVFFYRLSERKDIQINSLSDAKKYSVCAVRGDYRAEYLQQNGFTQIDLAADSTSNVKKILAGRCDLGILTEIGMNSKLNQLNEAPDRVRIAYALQELDSNLYIAINSNSDPQIIKQLQHIARSLN
jgi:polar amino acid transport system substrate-binding protein